MTALMLQQGY